MASRSIEVQGFQPSVIPRLPCHSYNRGAGSVHLCSASRQPDSCQRRSHAMALVQGCRGLQGWLASIRAASSCAISSSASCRHVNAARQCRHRSALLLTAEQSVPILSHPRGPPSCPDGHCVATPCCSAVRHASHPRIAMLTAASAVTVPQVVNRAALRRDPAQAAQHCQHRRSGVARTPL